MRLQRQTNVDSSSIHPMKIAFLVLAAACLTSCSRPNIDYTEIVGKPWSGPDIPRPEWRRIEARFRQASYPRPALGLLSEFDRATVQRFLWSPALDQTRQYLITNRDSGRHERIVGMLLDRQTPTDVPRFAAILCGEAPDPHHVKITSIEISGILPEPENEIGNYRTVIFRSH
jgi:hypothetical protein